MAVSIFTLVADRTRRRKRDKDGICAVVRQTPDGMMYPAMTSIAALAAVRYYPGTTPPPPLLLPLQPPPTPPNCCSFFFLKIFFVLFEFPLFAWTSLPYLVTARLFCMAVTLCSGVESSLLVCFFKNDLILQSQNPSLTETPTFAMQGMMSPTLSAHLDLWSRHWFSLLLDEDWGTGVSKWKREEHAKKKKEGQAVSRTCWL